jgi:hypothetical protein
VDIFRVLDPVALQGAEIIAVAQVSEELFENRPVSVAAGGPELTFKVALEIILNTVIVEECVVDIDQKNNWARRHEAASSTSLVSGL